MTETFNPMPSNWSSLEADWLHNPDEESDIWLVEDFEELEFEND